MMMIKANIFVWLFWGGFSFYAGWKLRTMKARRTYKRLIKSKEE